MEPAKMGEDILHRSVLDNAPVRQGDVRRPLYTNRRIYSRLLVAIDSAPGSNLNTSTET